MVRVERVTPMEGYRLRIGFTDGTERLVDAEPFLRGPILPQAQAIAGNR